MDLLFATHSALFIFDLNLLELDLKVVVPNYFATEIVFSTLMVVIVIRLN